MTDMIAEAALSEIAAPQLATTEQILAVHALAATHGVVQPISIEPRADEQAYRVSFAIADQPYFFVVLVVANASLPQAKASFIEASVHVYLAIYSKTLDPDTITQRIGITPSRTSTKGDPVRPRASRLYLEHRWYLTLHPDPPRALEIKLRQLLGRIVDATEAIVALAPEADVVVHIVYKGYQSWMGGVHLDPATLHQVAALGAAIDLDLYAYGPELLD